MPVRCAGDDTARQHDLAIVAQPGQRFRNFIGAKVRFHQESFGIGALITLKLRSNAHIDVMRGGRARPQELNLRRKAEIRAIGVRIEHCATGNGALFGRIADNEAVADKRDNR